MQKMGKANSIQPLVESKGQKVQEAQAPVPIFYHCIVYTTTIYSAAMYLFTHPISEIFAFPISMFEIFIQTIAGTAHNSIAH